jgi:hypothetical protein
MTMVIERYLFFNITMVNHSPRCSLISYEMAVCFNNNE